MSLLSAPIENQTTKSSLRLLLKWRDTIINFGTFEFKKDGSLIYSSAFHADLLKYPMIEIGRWKNTDALGNPEKRVPNTTGIHVSLHPKDQILHIRENGGKRDLIGKKMNWFPVKEQFLLLKVISPPLDECIPSKKEKDFRIEVADQYTDSVEVWVRILPWADNLDFHPQPDKDLVQWVLGSHRNYYWVVCGVFRSNRRSPAALFYPND
jgi:hypothetical protein